MKPANLFSRTLAIFSAVALLAGCSKPAADKPADAPEKNESERKSGVTLDAATQARLGLKTDLPAAMTLSPEVKGYGVVLDPSVLLTAVADLESAVGTAELSSNELARQKFLAAQNNSSAKVLQAAQAAATHDRLASAAALAKFKFDWGAALTDAGRREEIISAMSAGKAALVRIDLPPGEILPAVTVARIVSLTDETNAVSGEFFGATEGVNPQTQSQSLFFLVKDQPLTRGAAVTGFLKIAGEPLDGVVVPTAAVLRHAGAGWVYVQTETNQFVRVGIPLDQLTEAGWFVPAMLSATNRIVVVGAQSVLSAELGGGFTSGMRD